MVVPVPEIRVARGCNEQCQVFVSLCVTLKTLSVVEDCSKVVENRVSLQDFRVGYFEDKVHCKCLSTAWS